MELDKSTAEAIGGFAETTTDAILVLDKRLRALEGMHEEILNLQQKIEDLLKAIEGKSA